MRTLIIFFAFLLIVVSCNKDNNSNSGIVIKGRISGSTIKGDATKGASALSLSDAKQVFVVNLDNGMLHSEIIEISGGNFQANATIGMATALVFLDANSKYIGTLSSRGLNLLPLNKLTEGENTSIDLADLTLVGSSVVPSHDPFGNEIIINDDEINRLKELDGFFETLAKNIDADNNNVLDALSDKQLFIKTRFWVHANHYGLNSSPKMSDIDLNSFSYHMELEGGKGFSKPNSIVVSGPADSPYNDIVTFFINSGGDNGGFYSGITRTGGLFKKGIYSINIDGYNCTMDYSNIDASHSQLFVLPTLHTNSEGKMVSISLEYKLPNGNPIDPINFLTDVMIQFTDESQNQYFNSPWLRHPNTGQHHCNCVDGVFSYTPDSPVDISHLVNITIPYNDLLGNTYFITWSK